VDIFYLIYIPCELKIVGARTSRCVSLRTSQPDFGTCGSSSVWPARPTDNGSCNAGRKRTLHMASEPSRSVGHWYGWRDLQVVVLEAAACGYHTRHSASGS
jgi:hypothetical protein